MTGACGFWILAIVIGMCTAVIDRAGIFNSGTNLMTNLLRKNCVMPLACPGEWGQKRKTEAMARRECIGYPFQAPWGKHNPLAYRNLGHVVDSLDHFNLTEILPVAVVKDPITWMRSMCRIAYAAHFRKHPACCPSPLDPAQLGELLGHNRSKVTVKFRKEHPEEVYGSLLDLWNVWYREYYDATLPRLIVRYEDLLIENDDNQKALSWQDSGTIAMRDRRIKRAIDLSMKHTYLPDHVAAVQDPGNFYLSDHLQEAKKLLKIYYLIQLFGMIYGKMLEIN